MKMQDKVLKAFEDITKEYDFEFIVNFNHANTGRAFIMNGFNTDFYINFSFQTNYASITFYNPNEKEFKSFGYLEYHKAKEMNQLISFYDDVVREAAIERDSKDIGEAK